VGFRFRRSIKILPGIRINLGKRGVSTSIGVRGAHVTFGRNGTRTTVGLPGTGLSYTHLERPAHPTGAEPAAVVSATESDPQPAQRDYTAFHVLVAAVVVVGLWMHYRG
jgi:Protein of unknown function (DUF4236)